MRTDHSAGHYWLKPGGYEGGVKVSISDSPAALKRRLPTAGAGAFSMASATALRAGTAADGVVG